MERLSGRQPPASRTNQLRGWGLFPRRQLVPMPHLLGMGAPIGAGPRARETGSPA